MKTPPLIVDSAAVSRQDLNLRPLMLLVHNLIPTLEPGLKRVYPRYSRPRTVCHSFGCRDSSGTAGSSTGTEGGVRDCGIQRTVGTPRAVPAFRVADQT